jgi:sterol desaturase/sphingolipid hydroxylase (fatty acid hydroxylase superfamily)
MTESSPIFHRALLFARAVAVPAVWLVIFVAIFVPLEHFFSLHPAKIWRKQVGVDLCWYFINSLVPAAVIVFPLAALSHFLRGVEPGYYSAVAAWPLWLRSLGVLVVNDFGAYWGHRALHTWPVLWQFHAIHHSAEEMNWLVTTRAHPFDIVFTRMTGLVPVYLLGLAQATGARIDPLVVVVMVIGITWTYFIHANVRFRLGPLEWLVSSPAFHHWHHTNDEHRDRNFASILPIYDWLFGTAWLPKHWPPMYGIDAKVPPTLTGQFLDPLGKPPAK